MSKPLRECSREERLMRALLVIEGLTIEASDNDKRAAAVYRVAHTASGHCKNPHEDWQAEWEQLEKELKSAGVVDIGAVVGG
jgi:hypothetical protein